LCRLVNELQPGIVPMINDDDNVFAHTENIKAYLAAAQQLGVNQQDMFEVHDLLHNGDVQQVLRNIVALERAVVGRGYKGPKLELEDKCEREDCTNKIESLHAEIGSLKRQLRDKEEDNREVMQESIDYQNKLIAKEEELIQLRAKVQTLEASSAVLQEKYKLAMIDIQIVKQDYEHLQKQHEMLKGALATNSVNNVYVSRIDDVKGHRASISVATATDIKIGAPPQRLTSSQEGVKKGSVLSLFKRTPSSPDLKKLEEMRKFIKKEKKEIMRQEKDKKKHELKEKEKLEKKEEKEREKGREKEEKGEDGDNRPRLSALRSLTLTKLGKHKEKRQTISKDKLEESDVTKLSSNSALRSSRSMEGFKEHVPTESTPATRERSATAAGRLVSLFKPNVNTEANHATTVSFA